MTDTNNVTAIVELLEEHGVELFLNSGYEPTVRIPEDVDRQDWPVNGERFRDLVETVLHEVNDKNFLGYNERRLLFSKVREACRKGGRRLSQHEVATTENDPIVQAIICMMNDMEQFSGFTAVLLRNLRKIQEGGQICASPEISKFTNVFSRKLGRLKIVLRGYGVDLDITHKENGSISTLRRLPDFQRELDSDTTPEDGPDGVEVQSSASSSGVTPDEGTDLGLTDDDDGETQFDAADAKEKLTLRYQAVGSITKKNVT